MQLRLTLNYKCISMMMNQLNNWLGDEFENDNTINEIANNFELNVNISNVSSYLQDQEELCEADI